MGLSATPNTAATDLGAMLSSAGTAADKSQAASSGADTFGNLLSDRLNQEAARHPALRLELLGHAHRFIDRNRER
ncbi:hypothetical protein ACQCQL_03310, partial [Ralstonia pseudosolanacearum]